eukprot:m.263825 g.263825  ORF g.263825 m.263825 type:complete len:85 (+) comp40460_c0_seq8:203-457(+)
MNLLSTANSTIVSFPFCISCRSGQRLGNRPSLVREREHNSHICHLHIESGTSSWVSVSHQRVSARLSSPILPASFPVLWSDDEC